MNSSSASPVRSFARMPPLARLTVPLLVEGGDLHVVADMRPAQAIHAAEHRLGGHGFLVLALEVSCHRVERNRGRGRGAPSSGSVRSLLSAWRLLALIGGELRRLLPFRLGGLPGLLLAVLDVGDPTEQTPCRAPRPGPSVRPGRRTGSPRSEPAASRDCGLWRSSSLGSRMAASRSGPRNAGLPCIGSLHRARAEISVSHRHSPIPLFVSDRCTPLTERVSAGGTGNKGDWVRVREPAEVGSRNKSASGLTPVLSRQRNS